MPRQTVFYAHPDDYPELAAGLQALGAVVIGERSPTAEPVVVNIAAIQGPVSVMLTRPEYLAGLRPHDLHPHQDVWRFDPMNDPLAGLNIWRPREGVLRPAQVYYFTRSVEGDEPDRHFEDKPAEFVKFAEAVRRWIRRWCQKRHDILLAPSLAARFDRGQIAPKGIQGELELRLNG